MASLTSSTTCSAVRLLGQVGGKHLDLGLFVGGEFGASALFEALDGILPLLDLLADDYDGLRVVEHGVGAAFFDCGVLERRFSACARRSA